MPTELLSGNPFAGVGSGGGGINQVAGAQAPPIVNPLGIAMEMRGRRQEMEMKDQQLAMAKQTMQMKMMEMEGEKRMGAYLSANLDEETGEINPNFLVDIASDPLTQRHAQKAYSFFLESGKTNSETLNNRLKAASDRASSLGRAAFGVLEITQKEGRNVKSSDVSAALANLITLGKMTGQEAQKIMLQLPKEGPQLNKALEQFVLESEQSKEAIDRTLGTIMDMRMPDGSGTRKVRVGLGGRIEPIPGTEQPDTLTPAQLAEPIEVEDAEGRMIKKTRREWLEEKGQIQGIPGSDPALGGPAPVEAVAPAPTPDPTVSDSAPPAPRSLVDLDSKGIPLPMTPRQKQEQEEQVKDNSAYRRFTLEEGEKAAQSLGILDVLEDELSAVKTGGGGSYYAILGKGLQAIGASKTFVNKVANGDIAGSQLIDAMNTILGVQNFKDLSNQQNRDLAYRELVWMKESGVSLDNDPEANKKIIAYWKGLHEIKAARMQALSDWTEQGKSVESFRPKWARIERELIKDGVLRPGWREEVKE